MEDMEKLAQLKFMLGEGQAMGQANKNCLFFNEEEYEEENGESEESSEEDGEEG